MLVCEMPANNHAANKAIDRFRIYATKAKQPKISIDGPASINFGWARAILL